MWKRGEGGEWIGKQFGEGEGGREGRVGLGARKEHGEGGIRAAESKAQRLLIDEKDERNYFIS